MVPSARKRIASAVEERSSSAAQYDVEQTEERAIKRLKKSIADKYVDHFHIDESLTLDIFIHCQVNAKCNQFFQLMKMETKTAPPVSITVEELSELSADTVIRVRWQCIHEDCRRKGYQATSYFGDTSTATNVINHHKKYHKALGSSKDGDLMR